MDYKITIDKHGKIAVETSQVTGARCTEVSEAIRTALDAKIESVQYTADYYLPEPETLLTDSESEHQTT